MINSLSFDFSPYVRKTKHENLKAAASDFLSTSNIICRHFSSFPCYSPLPQTVFSFYPLLYSLTMTYTVTERKFTIQYFKDKYK
uniref:Uncharacterized protein n=2 Tax=unclassified Caudoviricetes TaxID=2788787 RepID=A0A8S5QJH6_9CAUD|nr:MAG TPA: hypothetical protein [Siphoviridae sp. ctVii20]DAE19407.1 MAG TPA: hypothetical protein [Siphoviridae sp. ctezl47]